MKVSQFVSVSMLLTVSALGLAQQADNEAFTPLPETATLALPKQVPADFRLPEGDSTEDNRVTRYIKDTVNVALEYPFIATTAEQYEQRINLMVASGDIPDAMSVSAELFAELAEGGLLEDLAPYYDDYASPLLKTMHEQTDGVALARATVDGQLLGIPSVTKDGDGVNFMWIRQDWLENLGLDAPQTLEELHEVARAFVEDDPDGNGQDDTVGIAATSTWQNAFSPIFAAHGAFPQVWVENSEGAAAYGSAEPEMKAALSTLQSWYGEGLIDPEFATLDTDGMVQKLSSGRAGIVFGPWWYSDWPLKFTLENVADADWTPYLTPLTDEGTFNTYYGPNTGSFFVVRKGYAYPEAAFKVVNLQAEYEAPSAELDYAALSYSDHPDLNVLWSAVWPTGTSFTRPDWLPFHAQNVQRAEETGEAEGLAPNEVKVLETVSKLGTAEMTPADWGFATAWAEGVPLLADTRLVPRRGLYQADTVMADSRIWPTLLKREDETMLRILTGQLPVDTFDTFTQEWRGLGGEDILESVQTAVAEE